VRDEEERRHLKGIIAGEINPISETSVKGPYVKQRSRIGLFDTKKRGRGKVWKARMRQTLADQKMQKQVQTDPNDFEPDGGKREARAEQSPRI